MAKRVDNIDTEEVNLDINSIEEEVKEAIEFTVQEPLYNEKKKEVKEEEEIPLVNPLRNEKVTVKFVPKAYCKVSDSKHVLYGGMSDNSTRTFVVPMNTSGSLVSVLSETEQRFLEEYLGYEKGTLSVSKKKDNFWIEGNGGISKVLLGKRDNTLDLSQPEDFIKYKILLANTESIAPSHKHMQDFPKGTYQYVIVAEKDKFAEDTLEMSATIKSYMEFGKISEDYDKLKFILETMEGKPIAPSTKLDFLKVRINELIKSDSKLFLTLVKDEYLDTKVLIKKAISAGIIVSRGTFLYLKEGNVPLCGNNAEPTLNVAAEYLNLPKNQEMLLTIQAKLNS